MDAAFLQTIIENDYAAPKSHSVGELIPQLNGLQPIREHTRLIVGAGLYRMTRSSSDLRESY